MTAEATDYPLVIQQLEAEIDELRRKLSQQNKDNKLLEAWRDHIHGTRSDASQCPTDVTKALVESMQYQKDLLVQVTGVDIEDSNTEILKQGEKTKMVRDAQSGRWSRELINTTDTSDDLSLVKRQIVDGNCGDIDFQLMLDVEENMDSDGIIHSNISQLSISASENIYIDMRDTIERLANERNAQGFLRMLDSYKTWRSAREKCFQHFVTTYPKVATSPSDDILHLKHPTKNFKFVIEWNLLVTDRYTAYPAIQLDIEMPKKVQEETDILTTAPEKFQLMLKELGIERTLKTLVMLLLR